MADERVATRIALELQAAEAARRAGNEGRARVCARRAAGLAAGEYLERAGFESGSSSAYEQLRRLERSPQLPLELRQAAARLTARVTEAHALPHPEDPLDDARQLIRGLLGGGVGGEID